MPDRITAFSALKELPASVAILDSSGTIVSANNAWKQFGHQNGLRIPDSAIGVDYLAYCRSDEPQLHQFAQTLDALLRGDLNFLTFVYPCHSEVRQQWFFVIGVPLSLDEPAGVALVHVNISDLLPPLRGKQLTRSELDRTNDILIAVNGVTVGKVGETITSEVMSAQLASMFTDPRQCFLFKGRAGRQNSKDDFRADRLLTERQMQILALLAKGKTNKEIARSLIRSPNTVKLHVSAILKRLNLKSRTEAALLFADTQKTAIADSLNRW